MVAISPMTSPPYPSFPLLLLVSCLLAGHLHTWCDAAGTAVLQALNCSTAGNYTPNDAYAANLNQILATLPDSTVSTNGGFFNGTAGLPGAPGTAYVLALCAADFARADCRDCLAMATSNSSGLVKQCPGSSTVVAVYDQCLVHYSDAGFFGTAYTDIVYSWRANEDVPLQNTYSVALKQGLVYLNAQAASSPQRFAVTKASPYALAQCTWDLPADKCQACLDLLATNISDFMTLKATTEARTYSCRLKQSNDSFDVFPFADLSLGKRNDTNGTISQEQGSGSGHRSHRKEITAVASVGAVVAASLVAVVVACCVRGRRARRRGSITVGDKSMQIDQLQEYRYEELKKATGNFSKDTELGRGAFGVVYKGTLENKKVIAVKKLQRNETVEVEQFMNEVRILSGLKHKNLVKLEGYCVHQAQEGLLCYEYLPDGNLEDRLIHGRRGGNLTWRERRHILQGICRGLQYLHDESPNDIAIMHMDLKTDNILLQVQEDKKNGGVLITPKISDFGISRNLDTDKQHEYVKEVVGNWSCLPPEFMERGKASTKVDIYSFGLIILEMVTGKSRKSSSSSSSSSDKSNLYGEGLIKQVREHWEKKDIDKIKDGRMDTKCDAEIEKCIEIALDCVHEESEMRPDIATIARRLSEASHGTSNQCRPDQLN
ncbi:cysteine-rich receptor-like protein kinase 29 [Phragmites australis]|uniref:cysteine-rich receptor-like protein kinase 29 n=1 Tax=Phragmites australis TaxID=29695 RepID=UPI002D798DA6|nr:cysteine-rich receptor-like protein kinase 29 [Phragmites australis]